MLFAPRELPPLSPDVAHDDGSYSAWVQRREEERRGRKAHPSGPDLRLVMVAPTPAAVAMQRTLSGLCAQRDGAWSLTVVTTPERHAEVVSLVRSGLRGRHRRTARTIVGAPAAPGRDLFALGLTATAAAPVALVFAGDVWAPDTVAQLRRALTPTGVVYADEDRLTRGGEHIEPRLKPDYSPDFLGSTSYVGRPLAVGSHVSAILSDLIADVDDIEHAYALHACAAAESVTHVAEVLCHRTDNDDVVPGRAVTLRGANDPGIMWPRATKTRIDIVIPFRDEPRFLRTCIDSVTATTHHDDIDVRFLLVDNGSLEPETLTLIEELDRRQDVQILRDDRPFNWARLNNAAAEATAGDVLLFLNNDIEAPRSAWLDALCAHALRPDVGAVGARLLYPDGRLQHCGIVVGLGGAAGHPLAGLAEGQPGYLSMATATRECSAVTGACLATRREVFDLLGGFDESLGVDLNDVDFCLRAARAGYRTLYEPSAELIHHESPSRGTAGGVGDVLTFVDRWRDYIEAGDRYFNVHLTRADPSCGLARDDEENAWRRWYSTLRTQ